MPLDKEFLSELNWLLKMPKLARLLKASAGFTLIELIIVIAVIGILATAVLAAINPLEQIRKGTDTGKKSDASEFLSAAERYLATFQCYPWAYVDATGCAAVPTNPAGEALSAMKTAGQGAVANTLTELVAKSELKAEYTNRKSLSKIYATVDAATGLPHICFVPESKTFQALAKLKKDGITSGCTGFTEGGANSCYVCVPE